MEFRSFERVRCPRCRNIKVDLLTVTPIRSGAIVNCRCLECEEVFGLPIPLALGGRHASIPPLLPGKQSRGYVRESVA